MVVWLLYACVHASFSGALFWVYDIQARYNGRLVPHGPLWFAVLRFHAVYWPTGLLLALGAASWIWLAVRGRLDATWGPAGLLLGSALYALVVPQLLEQYYVPILVTLVFFSPYIYLLACNDTWEGDSSWALAIIALVIMVQRTLVTVPELRETVVNSRDNYPLGFKANLGLPAYKMLKLTQFFLDIIPRNERFVGVGPSNPMFRRDATYMTGDERPSVSSLLPPKHPARRYFDAAYFRDELALHPPAMISLSFLKQNYPPGWWEVARDFLEAHAEDYRQILPSPADIYVRSDLAGSIAPRQERAF